MANTVKSVSEYLTSIPEDRRSMVESIRSAIRTSLPSGYEETISHNMIAYQVPLKKFPDTYNREPLLFAALASQRGYVSLYLMPLYIVPKFRDMFIADAKKETKKLDMAASCIRFKQEEHVPYAAIRKAIGKVSLVQFVSHAKKAHSKKLPKDSVKKDES